jgi:UDP-N-acetylmuramyl pentapeptide phosphotransferase/UDP-N-acetylglucosamine-1-phosphate transferase
MSLEMHQRKKNLYGGLVILLGVALASVAWAQIAAALSRYLSPF